MERIIEFATTNGVGAETVYIIPTDLYNRMIELAARHALGEDISAASRRLVKVLYKRRAELGAIIRLNDGANTEIHVGVRP